MVSIPRSPLGRLLPRQASVEVNAALSDTRVVLVNGARQCGKSTLVGQIARERGGVVRSLDDPVWREAARADPTEFLASDALQVIDEVQRVPELLLGIKLAVDSEPRPGRFLLTGSARLMGLRGVPDALPGRMETVELWPLSQSEIGQTGGGQFVDAVFNAGAELAVVSAERRAGYVERLVRGGFPEAVAREGKRREAFLDSYVAELVNRDVMQVAQIERAQEMRQLIGLLAARSGQILVPAVLSRRVGLPAPTIRRYVDLLEEVFLVRRIPAWSRNLSQRETGTPKIALVDSGIAASRLGYDAERLARLDSPLGGLLEGFVAMEIARQLTWSDSRVEMWHYRTKDQVEVDLVLEDRRGRVVAIDVKASSTVRADDFRGIAHLEGRLGSDLVLGLVLYTGQETVPFGPRRRAMPIAALWEPLS
ncbi:MAG: ATP-binding protein [Propionibacteriaceae bacterium]|nr:ATP-binding protein [Propionibacteriaceae bacterium]